MNQRCPPLRYALVTPARNEEQYLGGTMQSVLSQTVLPAKWVIVSDGSTDATEAIVEEYAARAPWIELVRLPVQRERTFAAKVDCFNAGYRRLSDIGYDVIGNLDADITFEPDYFSFLLRQFTENPELGVAGTPFIEDGTAYNYRFTNIEHVSGACQMFRRRCFEDIGGYMPIECGGIDWVAVTTARMKGWQTRTFTQMVCHHHRPMGTGNNGQFKAWFKLGRQDYFLGGHPLWQIVRSVYQMTRRPYLVAGLLLISGYFWAWAKRETMPVSRELMSFQREEQMRRLRRWLGSRMPSETTSVTGASNDSLT